MKKFMVFGFAAIVLVTGCLFLFLPDKNGVSFFMKTYITDQEEIDNMPIGKPFNYIVEENLDADDFQGFIDELIELDNFQGNPTYPNISHLSRDTLKNIAEYLRKEDLHVVPGEYELNSGARFKDGKFILYGKDDKGFYYIKYKVFVFEKNN